MYIRIFFVKNNYMKKFLRGVADTIKYYTDRRFSTIAGTLVYFFLMSIAPFILWLTLLIGSIDIADILPGVLFESVSPILEYLEVTAQSAISGAGVVLLLTSLYSSTNFFYHLRRSGEIVYGSKEVKEGIKLRILSGFLIIITIICIAFLAAFTITGSFFLRYFMPQIVVDIVSFLFLAVIMFIACLLMNFFSCPYKLKFSEAVFGSILTTVLWLLFIVGFSIYLQFASPGKLYGAIASLIVFLLWCYFMMCCFVIGMIKNSSYIKKKELKKIL